MKPIRLIVVAIASLMLLAGLQHSAVAVTSATCSDTTLNPGDTITVTGGGGAAGEPVNLFFDGTQIGGSTVGVGGFYSVSGPIPPATPGTYTIQVFAPSGGQFACFVTVVPAPTPTATAAPTAAPTAPPVATPTVIFVPVGAGAFGGPIVQQQQQQQQGGGGGGPQAQPGPGQQQFFPAPRFVPTGGVSLPKTGFEAARTAAIGSALLGFGLVLVLFARRRRRIARNRALAELPPIDAIVVEPEFPWLPGTAHPSEFLTEADGVPPVYTETLYLPAPAETDDDNILTPSF